MLYFPTVNEVLPKYLVVIKMCESGHLLLTVRFWDEPEICHIDVTTWFCYKMWNMYDIVNHGVILNYDQNVAIMYT